MNRVAELTLRRATVAIVFLCLMALTLCQVLGPTARINNTFAPGDVPLQAIAAVTPVSGAPGTLPARCASINMAPVEIAAADLRPQMQACGAIVAASSAPPLGAELGVPTPPPRAA